MSGLAPLPDEVLKIVMQHVPLEDRLTCCCLVNRKLHTAAVAATDNLLLFLAINAGWQEKQYKYASWEEDKQYKYASWEDVPPEQRTAIKSFQHADSFLQWLLPYGQHITSLSIMGFPRPLRQLPCPNLLELNLEECSVQLGPAADGSSGVIQGCTKLTCLQLSCNTIDAPAGAVLGSLSNLVHLQHLSVLPKVEMVDYCVGGLSSATLPRLHRLTRISVHSLSVENLLQLGGLTNLQVLQMSAPGDIFVGPSSVPGFVLPASLNELVLGSPVEAGILSVVPTELQELYIDCELRGPAEGPGSLLHGIASLDRLTRLVMNSPHGLNWPPPGPAYSALTASSNLQALYMYNTRPPAGVWPYVFPAARILPHLTALRFVDFTHMGEPDPPSAWGAGDLQHLISCCPNLYVIGIDLQHGQHVSELQELTALTCLDAYYDSSSLADREETFKGLAALTQLERLGIAFGDEQLPVAPFLPLTSLTTLTWLCVNNAALELKIEWDEDDTSPDVWLQLLERCAADPSCRHTVLRSLAQQLAKQTEIAGERLSEHEQQIADLQQQLQTQQQVVAGQGVQLAYLRSAVVQQQQQLSEQQRLAGEQNAALQAQLNELRAELQQLRQH